MGIINRCPERPPPAPNASVYYDANNDGAKQGNESGIGGTTITLTGTDDLGNAVSMTLTTAGGGSQETEGLRPGTDKVAETPPAVSPEGKENLATQGGNAINDHCTNVFFVFNDTATTEIYTLSLHDALPIYVYYDANNDGAKQGNESGIGGTTITLTGTDDLGNAVSMTLTTAGD